MKTPRRISGIERRCTIRGVFITCRPQQAEKRSLLSGREDTARALHHDDIDIGRWLLHGNLLAQLLHDHLLAQNIRRIVDTERKSVTARYGVRRVCIQGMAYLFG